jgi:glutathione S-transferase
MADKLVLGYWGIRGRAQPLKFLLEYTKVPYDLKVYTDPTEWFGKDKPALDSNPYANIPYIKEGDKVPHLL